MTPMKEIGECLVTAGDNDYFFRPSFVNMMRIGEPQQIVQAFYDLHGGDTTGLFRRAIEAYGLVPGWIYELVLKPHFQANTNAISAAMDVMQACCDADITRLIGCLVQSKKNEGALLYRPGVMPLEDMIVIAQSLITHGIIGKAKVRQLQRHDSRKTTTGFSAFEYISAARNHFNMSRSEAEQLSMTEFQLLIAAKYPEQKGYTRQEYDSESDAFFARRARRLAKSA